MDHVSTLPDQVDIVVAVKLGVTKCADSNHLCRQCGVKGKTDFAIFVTAAFIPDPRRCERERIRIKDAGSGLHPQENVWGGIKEVVHCC
jgi:hypothetical protein